MEPLITQMYKAFNRRDIDSVLAHMSENVSWPTASEGGRVEGKDQIRAYWTRQWAEFDPLVEPVDVIERRDGKVEVKVHQVVKTLHGIVLSDQMVSHTYIFKDRLIERMDILAEESGFELRSPR